jgi:hypothetical protein
MARIDYAIQTSQRTQNRWPVMENWTRHVEKPSRVRLISDEQVGRGDYQSAIDKTLYAIATYEPYFDWLYIMDDDGYVVPHRLENALAEHHADELHAIGCLCGKLCHEGAKFPALHGGCGFALSRGVASRLQQMLWHDDLVRHWRSSDGTISINLHRMNVVPRHDERFSSQLPVTEKFIACHGITPMTDPSILATLNAEQQAVAEANTGD